MRTKNWGTEILTDGDLEGQYDLIINWIMAALHQTTGHGHTGSANDGPIINVEDIGILTAGVNGDVLGQVAGVWGWITLTSNVCGLEFTIDGVGTAITTGIKGDIIIPFACTITKATLVLDTAGSIVLDLWKDTYANYPPTVADTITASAKPTIAGGVKAQDATLTGWTVAVAAGDIIRVNVDSVATATWAKLVLEVTKT